MSVKMFGLLRVKLAAGINTFLSGTAAAAAPTSHF